MSDLDAAPLSVLANLHHRIDLFESGLLWPVQRRWLQMCLWMILCDTSTSSTPRYTDIGQQSTSVAAVMPREALWARCANVHFDWQYIYKYNRTPKAV